MAESHYQALTPHLCVDGASDAIDFYKKAFDAKEIARHPTPDGKKLMHARIKINGMDLMLSDDFPEYMGGKSMNPVSLGGSPVTLHLDSQDADALWEQAVAAGATVTMPLADQFWGERYGQFTDPFGQKWSVGQVKEMVSAEDLQEAAKARFK